MVYKRTASGIRKNYKLDDSANELPPPDAPPLPAIDQSFLESLAKKKDAGKKPGRDKDSIEPPSKRRRTLKPPDHDIDNGSMWDNKTYQDIMGKIQLESKVSSVIKPLIESASSVTLNFQPLDTSLDGGHTTLDDPGRVISHYPPGHRTSSKTGKKTAIRTKSKLRYGNTKSKVQRNSDLLNNRVDNSVVIEPPIEEERPKSRNKEAPKKEEPTVVYQDHMVRSVKSLIDQEAARKNESPEEMEDEEEDVRLPSFKGVRPVSLENQTVKTFLRVFRAPHGVRDSLFEFMKSFQLPNSLGCTTNTMESKLEAGKKPPVDYDHKVKIRYWDSESQSYKEEESELPAGFATSPFDSSGSSSRQSGVFCTMLIREFEETVLLRSPLKSLCERRCLNDEMCEGMRLPVLNPCVLREFVTIKEWNNYQQTKVWVLPTKRRYCLLCLRRQVNESWWINAATNQNDASNHVISPFYNLVLREGEYLPHNCLSNDFGYQGQYGPVLIYVIWNYKTTVRRLDHYGEQVTYFTQNGIPLCHSTTDDLNKLQRDGTLQQLVFPMELTTTHDLVRP